MPSSIAATRTRTGAAPVVLTGAQFTDDHPQADGPANMTAAIRAVLEGGVRLAFGGRLLNIHPSLLPRHGGHGLYGDRVHESVLASGDTESGATVHLVTAGIDEGPVLAQSRVPVMPGDTLPTLKARVQAVESELMLRAVQALAARP